ncbi:hypothetical protein ABPG77_004388 [Micractinium sp. CCAP 211/92]
MPSGSTSPGADTPPTPKGLPAAKLPPSVSADHLVLLFLCLSLAFLILTATRAAVCGLLCALVHAALALAHSSRSGMAAVAACGRELGSVHALAAAGACLAALELAQDIRMWHASRAQALLWQAGGALAYVPAAAAVAAAAKRSEMLLWQGCAPREGSRLQIQHDYTASVQAAAAAV